MATRGDAAIIRPQERRDDDAVSLILRTNYPQLPHQTGIPFIYTGNSVENKRMLAINRSLGYEPLPRTVEIVKEL